MGAAEIPNEQLTAKDIPPPGMPWIWGAGLQEFALTFNGYNYSEECGDHANRTREEFDRGDGVLPSLSLSDLRACLFFEQRRWRHIGQGAEMTFSDGKSVLVGGGPIGRDLEYIQALVEAIRAHVATGIRGP